MVAAIRQDYDDDTPRLAMADWYDERGRHARAEFVRAHVELARVKRAMSSAESLVVDTPDRTVRRLPAAEYNAAFHRFRRAQYACDPAVAVAPPWPGEVHVTTDRYRMPPPGEVGEFDSWFLLERGFLGEVVCTARHWIDGGADLLRREPITRVYLTTRLPGVAPEDELFECLDRWPGVFVSPAPRG